LLITRAAGFLGSECIVQLGRAGHTILTTDRRGTMDFLRDLSEAEFCSGLPAVDAVVHCGAVQYLSPDLPRLARARYFRRNYVLGTRNLVDRYPVPGRTSCSWAPA
jgi:nucleoside-diphosphate-sugar epimerase